MSPSVFVDIGFFKVLDEFIDNSGDFEISKRGENRNQLIDILNESDIYADISTKDVLKLHKKGSSATYSAENWQEFVFLRALRKNRLSILKRDLSIPQRVHLLGCDAQEINEIVDQNNIFCEGIDYTYEHPISPISIASIDIDKEMNGIDKIKHRCRNVVLIEPYIFAPLGSKEKNVPKIPNFAKLLKELFLDNSSAVCHLSILYHRDSVIHSLVQGKIDEIKNEMNNVNLEVTAFGHAANLFQGNRHLITDYSIMDLQHPFDRDDSSISANFLYDRDIRESFQRVKKILDIGKGAFSSAPASFGLQQIKFGDMNENKLFQ